jgi:hypothetical protein
MSNNLYCAPSWFYGFDIFLEIMFAIVALIVALYAFRVYRLCEHKSSRLLGISFLLISLSYGLWALLNMFAVSKISGAQTILQLEQANIWRLLGIYAHILFYLTGLVVLTYMSLKVKNGKVLWILLALTILTTSIVEEKHLVLYLFSSILIIFIILSYLEELIVNKNKKVLLILSAFIFLFLGRLDLSFSYASNAHYVIGHLLELIAYGLILISLITIFNHGKKTK